MVVLALITGFVLRWTRFGRYLFAIGGNEQAAMLTGVPVRRIKVAVYMISALSAGIAGIVQTGWLGAVTTNIGAGMELQVIAAAVIGGANLAGGIGTAFGALVGSALIEVIRNSLGLARHQRLLAGHLHRLLHHHRRRLRPDAPHPLRPWPGGGRSPRLGRPRLGRPDARPIACRSLDGASFSACAGGAPAAEMPRQPAYVGSASCGGCHGEIEAGWAAVGPWARLDAAERGDGARGLRRRELRVEGRRHALHPAGRRLRGRDATGKSYDVVGVAGVRPLQQYLLSPEPGRTQAFDIAWDTERGRWYDLYPDQVTPPGDGMHWSGPYKSWEARCAECHATGYSRNYDVRAKRYDPHMAEIGVGCEACHGPGEAHAAWAADPGGFDAGRAGRG